MYHSITIGDRNTWDDWHLIPSVRPFFNAPALRTTYLETPGGDGKMDLTQQLASSLVYDNRIGSFDFYVMQEPLRIFALYTDIMNYIQGKELLAALEDDPLFGYLGRFTVAKLVSGKDHPLITIEYDVAPAKIRLG